MVDYSERPFDSTFRRAGGNGSRLYQFVCIVAAIMPSFVGMHHASLYDSGTSRTVGK
jgi:hypothetical protein